MTTLDTFIETMDKRRGLEDAAANGVNSVNTRVKASSQNLLNSYATATIPAPDYNDTNAVNLMIDYASAEEKGKANAIYGSKGREILDGAVASKTEDFARVAYMLPPKATGVADVDETVKLHEKLLAYEDILQKVNKREVDYGEIVKKVKPYVIADAEKEIAEKDAEFEREHGVKFLTDEVKKELDTRLPDETAKAKYAAALIFNMSPEEAMNVIYGVHTGEIFKKQSDE